MDLSIALDRQRHTNESKVNVYRCITFQCLCRKHYRKINKFCICGDFHSGTRCRYVSQGSGVLQRETG